MFERFFAAMGASEGAAMVPLLADDARWWFPQSGAEAGAVPRLVEGRDAVLSILGHADAFFARLHYTLDHVLEDGEMVSVHATARGATLQGRSYENEYLFLFRLRDGVIAEGWEFLDTAYAYSRNQPE
jgi:ketosteroid isomerase-like protein